jgi:hypothetical protein
MVLYGRMRRKLLFRVLIFSLVVVPMAAFLSSCQLFGVTQVSFVNSTVFTITTIQLGPLIVGSPLASGGQTGSFTISPGQNVLTAESQGGAWTNAVLLSIVAGHSYTVTFNAGPTFSQVTVSMAATN